MVPWKLGFHSAWQQSTLLSKETYSSVVVLGVAGQGLWEKPGRIFFFHFSPWQHPKASLPKSFADRVYRDRDRLYIPLASIWKSLNIDVGRMWVLFSSPLPVSMRGMMVYLYFEKVRLLNYPHIQCVWLFVCIYAFFLQLGLLSSSTTVCWCPAIVHP